MTGGPLTVEAFADHTGGHRFALDHVALQITVSMASDEQQDLLVLALHPSGRDRRVVASAGNSAIRAAISVAVAAGNVRAWSAAEGDAIVGVEIRTLPEIIRAAVVPAGIAAVHVATVNGDDGPACLAMWLSTSLKFAEERDASRRAVLARLQEAVDVDRRQAEAAADVATRAAALAPVIDAPTIDLLVSLPDHTGFTRTLEDLDSDRTGLLVLAIDDYATILATRGAPIVDAMIRAVAARLTAGCRKGDVIARIGEDTFAVLLVDVDRRVAFEIAKRLRSQLSRTIEYEGGDLAVEFSVGLAHEEGLIDPIELYQSARSATSEAQHAGGARMLVAS